MKYTLFLFRWLHLWFKSKTKKQKKYHRLYMNIAYNVASMSHCVKRKIGAILVKDGRVLSMGWNGMPAGWHNKCEKSPTETRLEVLHAETNMIAKIARSNESAAGAIVYSTYLPCIECAKMLYQSGIVVIYYSEYKTGDHNISGIKFLRKCRVPVIRIKMKNVQNNKNQEEINVVSTRARNQHKKTNNNI